MTQPEQPSNPNGISDEEVEHRMAAVNEFGAPVGESVVKGVAEPRYVETFTFRNEN